MGLHYAALLSLLVGLSVLIPYVGAAVVTIPVALVAFFQWGWTGDFFYLMLVYGIIQALDGNVLVPLLFSEAVNLHPVAIILAVLVFGGFWGLWGVFFAIPLATLIKALLQSWPKKRPAIADTNHHEKIHTLFALVFVVLGLASCKSTQAVPEQAAVEGQAAVIKSQNDRRNL